ncbi:hypothetical protein MIND_00415100 [Mycena indigotica]|uniref:Uncharacterized protein n=1 Tax=Mycena indigotica TaxID=2126181 RepID=A0A8H6SU71_9AGAR|nr:uncharacterized protein MIND_00415100 [Mycena indigotica]KAF7306245.1 hypothetical protein MIND_00415100 [Mycena indigotica]
MSSSESRVCMGDSAEDQACRCQRYIPNPNQSVDDTQVCRDCKHWESMHRSAPRPSTALDDILARVGRSGLKSSSASEEEARSEASSGFRKAEGQGGHTKFQRSSSTRRAVKPSLSTKEEKNLCVGQLIMIPNCRQEEFSAASDDDERSNSDSDIPVAMRYVAGLPGPVIVQELKDASLTMQNFTYRKSWSAEKINEVLMENFKDVFAYQDAVNPNLLEAGEFHWVPLALQGKSLQEFKKRGSICGDDLYTISSGKGKKVELKTIYLGLRFTIPHRVYSDPSWPLTFEALIAAESKNKGKGKAEKPASKQRKVILKLGRPSPKKETIVISDDETTSDMLQVEVKSEPTTNTIAATTGHAASSLFLPELSDTDDAELPTPEQLSLSAAAKTTVAQTNMASAPSSFQDSLIAPFTQNSNSSISTAAATSHLDIFSIAPVSSESTTFAPSRSVVAQEPLQPAIGVAGPSRFRDYYSETEALENLERFGTYREPQAPATKKRTYFTTFLEGSGVKSPERKFPNPWKRSRQS